MNSIFEHGLKPKTVSIIIHYVQKIELLGTFIISHRLIIDNYIVTTPKKYHMITHLKKSTVS